MNLFERQLAQYASYHRDARNRATHYVGVPAIVLSLMPPLALISFVLLGYRINAMWVVAFAVAVGWIVLDRMIGIVLALAMIPMLVFSDWIVAAHGTSGAWWTFGVLFVGGWILQIAGHALFEGRRPALVDNLFQAYIGPMFLVAELLIALGLRDDLAPAITEQPVR